MRERLHLKNADIKRLVVGIPDGHSHIRAAIETRDGDQIILQEATLAAIVRGYTTVKTSPTAYAVEFESAVVPERKKGYADHQLVESAKSDAQTRVELGEILSGDQ